MNTDTLPAPDRTLSPHTGWTREHWTTLADRMLLDARPFASTTKARIVFPGGPGGYGHDVDGLEGFARTLLAAGFRIAGLLASGEPDEHGIAGWYAEGIAAGVDPENSERWVRPDEHDQAKVEAAAIALALSITKPVIWDGFDDRTKARVVAWLSTAIEGHYPPINWVWFRIVVQQFLRSVGAPWSREHFEADLALHDTFVREGGWYADGAERAYDHYAGWALHLYPALWMWITPDDDEYAAPRRDRLQAHLDRFLEDAIRLVGADGSPLLQGRSLIYRFAAAAPLWAGALTGSPTVQPGLVRRATSGIVRHFVDHDAFTHEGVLTLGWHQEWRAMAQSYSGPGSPYWASKGFLGLALPADHPVWTATEEPLPLEIGDDARVAAAPGWLISGTRSDGIVRVVNHGTDHAHPGALVTDAPLYARLGYSTATAPPLDEVAETSPLDQTVALLDADDRPSHRAGFHTLAVREVRTGTLLGASTWTAHWVEPDPSAAHHGSGRAGIVTTGRTITCASLLRGAWEVRLVRIGEGRDPGVLRVGGWPVTGALLEAADGTVATERLVSLVLDLGGLPVGGVRTDEDTTPLSGRTGIPWVATDGPAEAETWYASALLLAAPGAHEAPGLDLTGSTARIAWPDGTTDLLELAEVTSP